MKKIIYLCFAATSAMAFGQFNIQIKHNSPQIKEVFLYSLNGSKEMYLGKMKAENNLLTYQQKSYYKGCIKVFFQDSGESVYLASENADIKTEMEFNDKPKIIAEKTKYLDKANILFDKIKIASEKRDKVINPLLKVKALYKANDPFLAQIDKELSQLQSAPAHNFDGFEFNQFYANLDHKTSQKKFDALSDDERKAQIEEYQNLISNANEMLETSGLMRQTVQNYLNLTYKFGLDKGISDLLAKVNIESVRGQLVLSEMIDIFNTYNMAELKTKYLAYAKELKCSISGRLKQVIEKSEEISVGKIAPDYKFTNAKNTSSKSVHEVQAKKKLLLFWFSNCPHCMMEIPKIIGKYKELKQKGVEIIGFSFDSDKALYNATTADLPWINDSELKGWQATYADLYNIGATPSFIILDEKNTIISIPKGFEEAMKILE